jgi:hypothetical protein
MPLLQRKPDRLQNAVEFLANLMIPESDDGDSPASQQLRSRPIPNLARTIVMPAAVQFDRELRGRTVKIEDITINWMLAAKLVACKIPVP